MHERSPGRRLLPSPLAPLVCALLLTLPLAMPAPVDGQDAGELQAIQQLLDAGRPDTALERIRAVFGRRPQDAEVFLLRSTARFMLGQTEEGTEDLDRALELDPELRQGWLNRAALEIAAQRYDAALEALRTAQRLDPSALDSDLNIGAVLLIKGDPGAAAGHLARYLERSGGTAEAYYLVATNYATAGLTAQAVEYLAAAVEREETVRLTARADPRFVALADDPAYRRLMDALPAPPAAGSLVAQETYAQPFQGGDGKLLPAVLDVLQLAKEPFDPRVEVTAAWALIQGERMRIEVRALPDGTGLVRISAPPDRFSERAWKQRTDELLRRIQARLVAG